MHKISKVEEFKASKELLYVNAKEVLSQKYKLDNPHIMELEENDFDDEDGEGERAVYTHEARETAMYAELAEAVQDKRELLEDLRKLEPVAALEECREALALAEQIAGGADGHAVFAVDLAFVKVENVKPSYAAEADKLVAQCKPFLSSMDEKLAAITGRIEAVKEKAQDDPAKLEKVDALKKLREVAIIEGRDTAGIEQEIIEIQNAIEAEQKAKALADEEAGILSRHAATVMERHRAVADIVAHIEGVADAFRAFCIAAEYNKTALELGELAKEFTRLSKRVASAPGGIRVPETNGCRLSFELPRLEGSLAYVDDWGKYTRRIYYGPERDLIVKI